ncbi:MAG: metalloregulator ArsR/SmtB family transcription factor [Candidatus Eisenbacteria bacterium]
MAKYEWSGSWPSPTIEIGKAIADESRLRILNALRGGELCVCQIVELLGLAPSTTSKHLNQLRRAGLLQARKKGTWVWYRLAHGAEREQVEPSDRSDPGGAREEHDTASVSDPRIVAVLDWILASLANEEPFVRDLATLRDILTVEREEIAQRQRGCCEPGEC